MDWQKLFLTFEGRIKRQDFWIAWLILFAANFILGFVPLIGLLVHAFSIYVGVCIYSKRLHDMGRSAFLQLVPFGVWLVCMVAGVAFFGAAMISAFMAMGTASPGPAALAAVFGSMGGFLLFLALAGLVNIAFLIWIGATPGQLGPNQYGPDPMAANTADVF